MKGTFKMSKYYKFSIYLIAIVLVNMASMTLFFRMDLTSNNVYSLSDISKEVVATLSEPLTINVFFNSNLPAPYNNIERYLRDLLEEFAIAGNKYFNYKFYNVSNVDDDESKKNQELAEKYGIHPLQIQIIEKDEVKFQNALMGMVLIHGDMIETLPRITSTEKLEYEITSAIQKMNNKISTLLRLQEKIKVKLFLSSSLNVVGPYMNLTGLPELSEKIKDIIGTLNEKNYGKLSFSYLDPSIDKPLEEETKKYDILSLQWQEFEDRSGKTIQGGHGYAGIVVEHKTKAESIQVIKVLRLPLFGTQYQLADIEELEKAINETVENVININEEIGYLADHDTQSLNMVGASFLQEPGPESLANFHSMLAKNYSINQLRLKGNEVPEGLSFMIIAGPKERFSEYELYQIDQFLMKGKNLAIFMDVFKEITPESPQRPMLNPTVQRFHVPLDTGLEKMLAHYGLIIEKSFVLDENCFKQNMPKFLGGGEQPLYFAPILQNELINKELGFLKNIKGMLMLKASPVKVDEQKTKEYELRAKRLFSSSNRSWEMSERINLDPVIMKPPIDDKEFRSISLAYILEGSFPSYFADKAIPIKEEVNEEADIDDEAKQEQEEGIEVSKITTESATIRKGKPAKIFLIGTSEILKNTVLDDGGLNPNSQFVMNVIDYLNNREANAILRSKTQQFNPLKEVNQTTRTFVKTVNIAGLPMLVVFAGLFVWLRRISRKRKIQELFRK